MWLEESLHFAMPGVRGKFGLYRFYILKESIMFYYRYIFPSVSPWLVQFYGTDEDEKLPDIRTQNFVFWISFALFVVFEYWLAVSCCRRTLGILRQRRNQVNELVSDSDKVSKEPTGKIAKSDEKKD